MVESPQKVSIVLPTYNGAKYIRQSIDSCLNQTYKNIELIIVDDCSSDETLGIILSYKDDRIKYIRHEKNRGLPHALNTGFAEATGEYLTWTSDDNYYIIDAIEKMVIFSRIKNCDFIYCDFYRFNDENPANFRVINLPDALSLNNHNDVGACILYSKRVKETIGDYDTDAFLGEDYDYWIRVSKKFTMCHLAQTLYYYREHVKSLSLSRFHEVRVVNILVRMKNEVLDINNAVDILIDLIARRYPRYFICNRRIAKILYSNKIKLILQDFKSGNTKFKATREALATILGG